jgi:hypothetical protein
MSKIQEAKKRDKLDFKILLEFHLAGNLEVYPSCASKYTEL